MFLMAACCLLLATFSSCNSKKSADTVDNETEAVTDVLTEENAQEDAVPDFMSEDLKAEALRGQVKQVVSKFNLPQDFELAYKTDLSFNANGKNTTQFYFDNENDVLERNSDGIFVKISFYPASDGTNANVEYLELNEYGHPLKATFSYEGPGANSADGTMTFSDYVYDSNKNWTSRKVSAQYKQTDFETEAVSEKNTSWIENREVTYY